MSLKKNKELRSGSIAPEPVDTMVIDQDLEFDAAAVDEVMKKYDRESNVRVWDGAWKYVIYSIMAAFSVYVIIVTLFLTQLDLIRYPLFIGGMVLIGYLNYPIKKGAQKVNHIPWYDWIIMLLGSAAFAYVAINAQDLTVRLGTSNIHTYEIIIGIIGLLAVAELCRRAVGIPILCVAGAFLVYALIYFAFIKDKGMLVAVRQVVIALFYKVQGGGLLNTPIQVCAKFIMVFIIFGAFLERTGISDFFIALANSIAGSASGGPAKVAVISSALCGMVSGSSVGNTVTTGSVTIPMMKKTGYKPEFAGAVEAAASTGGQIMPPIMGAAAFLMAEYVGVPYSNIIVRAILPAVLYFTGIFICVHLEAKRLGLKGISRDQLPKFVKLVRRIYLLIPLILLVWLVSSGSSTMAYAAALSIVACLVVYIATLIIDLFLMKKNGAPEGAAEPVGVATQAKKVPIMTFDSLANGAKSSISVAIACCIAGCISGSITMTGLASKLTNAIVAVAGMSANPTIANLIALFFTMLCCIVLGMGVPTTANYCIMASTCAPILIQMGIPQIAAHFFVFYFGIVADITPPVALAAYAGSAIARSSPMKTAFNATKLAIAAFVVPYIFALNPIMLFEGLGTGAGAVISLIVLIITSIIGIFAIAAGLEGYLKGSLIWPIRIAIIIAGLLMLIPGTVTDIIGIVVFALILVLQIILNRRAQAKA